MVLARILGPDDFGIVALAGVFVALAGVFQDQGFSVALVQREAVDDEHLDAAFWFGLGFGAALWALVAAVAEPLSSLLDEPRLAGVLRVLGASFVLSGLAGTPTALLRRSLAFRRLAARTLLSSVVAAAVGLVGAIAGWGVWALVAQTLTQGAVAVVVLWASTTWRPRWRLSRTHFADLYRFGWRVAADDLLVFASRRGDDLVIGTALGAKALGYYSVAYRVLTLLTEMLIRPVSQVAMAVFPRLQGDLPRLRSALFAAVRVNSTLTFPVFLLAIACSSQIVQLLFGSDWEQSVDAMRILLLIGPLHAVYYFNDVAYISVGRPGIPVALDSVYAALNVAGYLIGVQWGVEGVALAYTLRGYVVAGPLGLVIMQRVLAVDPGRYLRELLPALVGASAAAGAVALVAHRLEASATPVVLGVAGVAGVAVYAAAVTTLRASLLREVMSDLRGLRDRRGASEVVADTDPLLNLDLSG